MKPFGTAYVLQKRLLGVALVIKTPKSQFFRSSRFGTSNMIQFYRVNFTLIFYVDKFYPVTE